MTGPAPHDPITPSRAKTQRRGAWHAAAVLATLLGIGCWIVFEHDPPASTSHDANTDHDLGAELTRTANDEAGDAGPGAASREGADTSEPSGLAGRLLQGGEPLAGATVQNNDDPKALCTSAADGSFLLPHGTGSNRLTIRGPTVPPGFTFGPITLAAPCRYDVGDIVVPRPGAITGRVLDEAGQPLAGVMVFAADPDADVYPFHSDGEGTACGVMTATDGRFHCPDLKPGTVAVAVDHPDRMPATYACDATVVVDAGAVADVGDLVLQRFQPLLGLVCDQRNQPIAGARVMPGGGDRDLPHPRRAIETDADGHFALRGGAACDVVTVTADGYEERTCELRDELARPFVIRLDKASVLAVVVEGTGGKPGWVRVEPEAEPGRGMTLPLAENGRFHIAGLKAGRHGVRAFVPGIGDTDVVACELPRREPLHLQLTPARTLTVITVDDRERPIRDARVVLEDGYQEWDLYEGPLPQGTTDGDGKLVLARIGTFTMTLRAEAKDHCPVRVEFETTNGPDPVILRLPRAGWLQGDLAAAELRANIHLRIHLRRMGDDGFRSSCAIDSRGRFHSGPLATGTYQATIGVSDAVAPSPWHPPVAQPLPLLATNAEVGRAVTVHVAAGQTTTVRLPAPPIGQLHGRVVAAGTPVRHAVVLAERGEREASEYPLPYAVEDREDRFMARTDAAGCFRFLAPHAGTFRLRARHAQGAGWSPPFVVQVPAAGSTVACDIHLDAATIRGRLDLSLTPPIERRAVRLALYALRDAGRDPSEHVWTEDGSKWLAQLVPEVSPDRAGAFAFGSLPAGDWLCRIVGDGGILLQQLVHLSSDADVDLGILQPGTGVVPQLQCGLDGRAAVLWQQLVGGHELFLRTVDNSKGNGFAWGALAPGRYRLRAMTMTEVRISDGERAFVRWRPDALVGDPVEIDVHADGRCTPTVVWAHGIK